jgi:hypothetical protein
MSWGLCKPYLFKNSLASGDRGCFIQSGILFASYKMAVDTE